MALEELPGRRLRLGQQHRGVHGGDGSAAFTSSLDVLWRESGTKNPRSSRQPPIAASSDLATSDAAKAAARKVRTSVTTVRNGSPPRAAKRQAHPRVGSR